MNYYKFSWRRWSWKRMEGSFREWQSSNHVQLYFSHQIIGNVVRRNGSAWLDLPSFAFLIFASSFFIAALFLLNFTHSLCSLDLDHSKAPSNSYDHWALVFRLVGDTLFSFPSSTHAFFLFHIYLRGFYSNNTKTLFRISNYLLKYDSLNSYLYYLTLSRHLKWPSICVLSMYIHCNGLIFSNIEKCDFKILFS